jgi:two-component system CitB family response regulator
VIKILIVEDDPAIAEIHRRFVQRLAGFEVLGWRSPCSMPGSR